MTTPNQEPKPADNMELLKREAAVCGNGCACHASAASGRMRWVVGAIVLLAAAALVARAVLKDKGPESQAVAPAFAVPVRPAEPLAPRTGTALATQSAVPASAGPAAPGVAPAAANVPPGTAAVTLGTTPQPGPDPVVGKEIAAFAELNTLAAGTTAAFVFLPGERGDAGQFPTAPLRNAVQVLERQGMKVGLFTLKPGTRDYGTIAAQVSVPAVLALAKGRGMSAVSGEITETKLIQGFVAASSAGGGCGSSCGPASSGCK